MNAIHGTGVDGFLDAFGGVAVLADRSGASKTRLHNEGVGSHVGAIAAADADGLVDPNGLISHISPEQGFSTRDLLLRTGGGGKGVRRGVSQVSSVPAGHHEFNRTILGLSLFGDLKTFLFGGCQNSVQGVTLGEFGKKAFYRNLLLPEVEIRDQLI